MGTDCITICPRSRSSSKLLFASCVCDAAAARFFLFFCFFLCVSRKFFFFSHLYSPALGQAVITGVVPSPPRYLPSLFIAHRVQQPHCTSVFYRVLLTHAFTLSASQFVRKKRSLRIYTSMHSAGLELAKLTYNTRLEDIIT